MVKNSIMGTSIILGILFFLNGCSSDSEYDKAVLFCTDNNGTVMQSAENNETLCHYLSKYEYDDGEETYSTTCEINTFYNNPEACNSLEEEGISTMPPIDTVENDTPMKLREAFHSEIKQILEHMNHTGYTHKSYGPFVLHPSYKDIIAKDENNDTVINRDIDTYNLFLDCSGFVGYYIVQGIAKHLYNELNTCYHSSRPLAADFADTFKASKYLTTDANISAANLSDLDTNASAVVWGRVPHIKDARAGDIIVYKHTENITHHGECSNTVHGNTGHVLFVMETPKDSNKYDREHLVRVADSTTAPHSTDSRYYNNGKGGIKKGSEIYNKSSFGDNEYTAWTKRYNRGDVAYYTDIAGEVVPINYTENDRVELCDTDSNNTFHRRCADFHEITKLKIYPQTKHTNSSTGIGIGYIYISNDMNHYRVKKGAKKKKAEIYIGRPVKVVN